MPHALRMAEEPLITILMGTRNGARFLQPQLDSFLAQTHRNWALLVSDDGSEDATVAILRQFRGDHPNRSIRMVSGPQQGAAANYLSLLCAGDIGAGYVALSDQDDVWLPGKLARAIAALQREPDGIAVAYGARTILADEGLRPYGTSPRLRGPTGFRNALVQNIVAGNCAVLNGAAVALLRQAGLQPTVPFHDWWIYLLITGSGGRVVVDPEPVLIYRQHAANALGTSIGLRALSHRAGRVGNRDYAGWVQANLAALDGVGVLLTPDSRATLAKFRRALACTGVRRAWAIWRLGLRRQTAAGTALLLLAAVMGRV